MFALYRVIPYSGIWKRFEIILGSVWPKLHFAAALKVQQPAPKARYKLKVLRAEFKKAPTLPPD